jgi:hypothetical protein
MPEILAGIMAVACVAILIIGVVAKLTDEKRRDDMFVRLLKGAKTDEEREALKRRWARRDP